MKKTLKVKILDKRIDLPEKATSGSSGYDLQAAITEPVILAPGERKLIPTGLAIHIDERSITSFILPRSKKGNNGLVIGNLVGVMDSDYTGQWYISAWNRLLDDIIEIAPLEAIAQAVFLNIADVDFEEVEELDETERADGGISKENDTRK